MEQSREETFLPASNLDLCPCNLELESNVIDTSNGHCEKQFSQMSVTDAGMCITVNPLSQNAHRSSRDNLQSIANVTDTRDLQREKQNAQITSTDAGM
jgi:hypothetical protein